MAAARIRLRQVILGLALPGAMAAASDSMPGRREAPIATISVEAPGGLQLTRPHLVESAAAGRAGAAAPGGATATLEAIAFTVAAALEEAEGARGRLELLARDGARRSVPFALGGLARGSRLSVPVRLPITSDREGPLTAELEVTGAGGALIFRGVYGFGYPRYATSGPLTRTNAGAPVRDDFGGALIDERLWRIWHSDAGRVRLEQRDGRFWIQARGRAGYNGLVSRVELPSRDAVAVCRAGVASPLGGLHAAILHVCGSGRWSPDHWFELRLRAAPGGAARATIGLAIPPEHRGGYEGAYDLPPAGEDGYLAQVVCEAAANRCRGLVQVEGAWWQVGDAFEVPARRTRLEIKTSGPDKDGAATTIWFDDCRLYPRPENHYVTVVLQRPDGRPPGAALGGGDRQTCFDPDNREIPGCDFTVKLFDAGGAARVAETSTGAAFGYALLKLDRAPWDLYPAAARIRVFAGDRQIGPDHPIESRGVEGLYPDDVYTITLR